MRDGVAGVVSSDAASAAARSASKSHSVMEVSNTKKFCAAYTSTASSIKEPYFLGSSPALLCPFRGGPYMDWPRQSRQLVHASDATSAKYNRKPRTPYCTK